MHSRIAAIDAEIARLEASRERATTNRQLDLINDAISDARKVRRSIFRTL